MKKSTAICDIIAILAWGSVVWLFASAFYFQYEHGYLGQGPQISPTFGMVIGMFIWIGTPIIAFILSLVAPIWLSRTGRSGLAQSPAIALCAAGLPWAALQWIGLGAG